MTSQEFERMLSVRSLFTGSSGHKQEAPCLRDLIFASFSIRYPGNPEKVNEATKEYTDHLYSRFVTRTA